MTRDRIVDMTYFHGGVPGLALGDSLLPPSVTGRPDGSVSIIERHGLDGAHVRGDRVFLGTLEVAYLFAAMYPLPEGGWIYEVDPVGDVEPDPDYTGGADESVQCPSAVIVRVVGPLPRATVHTVRQLMGAA